MLGKDMKEAEYYYNPPRCYRAEEESDVFQQLVEKDKCLVLAGEVGNALLERNRDLTTEVESLHEECLQKLEDFEQEKHHWKQEISAKESIHESQIQELQQEMRSLGTQLRMVEESSRTNDTSARCSYQDLAHQNSSLLCEVDRVKSANQQLNQQLHSLSERINEINVSNVEPIEPQTHRRSDSALSDNVGKVSVSSETQALKHMVGQLANQRHYLELSLKGLITDGKVTSVEDASSLREMMVMYQNGLQVVRRKNAYLKSQLEEYVETQSLQELHFSTPATDSLQISDSDKTCGCMRRSPTRHVTENGETGSWGVQITDIDNYSNAPNRKTRRNFAQMYSKLSMLKRELCNQFADDEIELHRVTSDTLTELLDEVIDLIHSRMPTMDLRDQHLGDVCESELESCGSVSQTGSRTMEKNIEFLEQQVHDLNEQLDANLFETSKLREDLSTAVEGASKIDGVIHTLTVKNINQQCQIDNLLGEREILLNNKSLDGKLKTALRERDEAIKRNSEYLSKREDAERNMSVLNEQLLAAVHQKQELYEQLEEWQFDMTSLIEHRMCKKVKRDQEESRRRNSSPVSSKKLTSFATKWFTSKSTSSGSSTSMRYN